jgi:hypothetical protein
VLHVCNRRHTGGIGRRFTIWDWPRQECKTLTER